MKLGRLSSPSNAIRTFDFGPSFGEQSSIMSGDDELDLFVFFGSPKEIQSEYTKLTGRSPIRIMIIFTGDPEIFGGLHLGTSGRGKGHGDLRDSGLDSGGAKR